ncbi:MAG TPA: ATP synthase F1 subunit delta [Acidisarcina sp.]
MSIVATRYGRALADVVADTPLDPLFVDAQLDDFAAAWHDSADLREIMENPSFPTNQKLAILDKLNSRLQMSAQVRNFIAVLISNDRLVIFDDVLAAYRVERDRRQGVQEVEVVSARKLEEAERQELEGHVAELAGSRIHANFEEDGTLLGGAVIKIGSTVYDGSVRGRLDRLREQLVSN